VRGLLDLDDLQSERSRFRPRRVRGPPATETARLPSHAAVQPRLPLLARADRAAPSQYRRTLDGQGNCLMTVALNGAASISSRGA